LATDEAPAREEGVLVRDVLELEGNVADLVDPSGGGRVGAAAGVGEAEEGAEEIELARGGGYPRANGEERGQLYGCRGGQGRGDLRREGYGDHLRHGG
jgi:hypothetical protein